MHVRNYIMAQICNLRRILAAMGGQDREERERRRWNAGRSPELTERSVGLRATVGIQSGAQGPKLVLRQQGGSCHGGPVRPGQTFACQKQQMQQVLKNRGLVQCPGDVRSNRARRSGGGGGGHRMRHRDHAKIDKADIPVSVDAERNSYACRMMSIHSMASGTPDHRPDITAAAGARALTEEMMRLIMGIHPYTPCFMSYIMRYIMRNINQNV